MKNHIRINLKTFHLISSAILCLCLLGTAFANELEAEYDFVVVGAGPAGGTVATRLAHQGHSVLLLEAGPEEPSAFYKTAFTHPFAAEDKNHAWHFYVENYSNEEQAGRANKGMCYSIFNRSFKAQCNKQDDGSCTCGSFFQREGIYYPRGIGLGGSAAVNAMFSVLPKNSDWNNIATITGDSSWEADNMYADMGADYPLGYASKVREWLGVHIPDTDNVLNKWHGVNVKHQLLGAMEVVNPQNRIDPPDSPSADPYDHIIETLNQDLNDATRADNAEGMWMQPLATKDGYRNSSRERILATACKKDPLHYDGLSTEEREQQCKDGGLWDNEFNRPLLTLQANSLVTKVLLKEGSNNHVDGVEYLYGQNIYKADLKAVDQPNLVPQQVHAKKEVILSAGVYNSPQILMMSGIGDKNLYLRSEIDIPHIKELKGVGKNLQEHYEVGVVVATPENTKWYEDCFVNPLGEDSDCLEELANIAHGEAEGTLGSTNFSVGSIMQKSTPDKLDPDLHVYSIVGDFRGYYNGYALSGLLSPNHFSWMILKGHTEHKGGYLTLRTDDPTDYPEINFQYFEDGDAATVELGGNPNASATDMDATMKGVKMIREVVQAATQSYQDETGSSGEFVEVWPGAEVQTDEQLIEAIKEEAYGHHPTSSLAIGSSEDPYAVLDTNFRVHGMAGLRVVDGSVFPDVPGTFPLSTIYVLAEKAADVIDTHYKSCTGDACYADILDNPGDLATQAPERAAPAICNSPADAFSTGLQAHGDSGEISVDSWSIIHDTANALPASTVSTTNNLWFFIPVCQDEDCSATSTPVTSLASPDFYENLDAQVHPTITVKAQQVEYSDHLEQFDVLEIGDKSIYTFNGPAETTYRINELKTGLNTTVKFSAGDYWIDNLTTADKTVFIVEGPGTVRLFIKNTPTIGAYNWWNYTNNGETPEKLTVYAYNDFSPARGAFSGFFYSEGDMNFAPHTWLKGSVTGENLNIGSSTLVYGKEERVGDVEFGHYICSQ